jgi:outer membrane protein
MKRYFVSFLLLSLTALASAEAPPSAFALSWQDCVQMAARNNPALLSSLLASESSRALYLKSYNGILPQINFSHTYTDSKSSIESKSWNAQGSVSLDLIDFGQWASIQSVSASMQESLANLQAASSQTLLDLFKAFSGLLYSQYAIDVNVLIRNTWKQNSQMINLRYQSGRESKGNNMNTQAQYLQAELNLDQARRDLRVAQQQLSQAIGKDDFSALVVTGTWNGSPVPAPRPNFEAYLSKHPQIIAQKAAVDQARASVALARSTLLPTLSLDYARGRTGPTEFPDSPYWSFSGSINLPIFAGGLTSTYYATQSAQRNLEKSQQDLRSLRNQLRTNLESSWASFAAAEDNVRIQNAFLRSAAQRKSESDIRYQSGLMTFNDWIIVIQSYVAFEQSYLRAEQNRILAEAQWRFATGEQL